MYRLFTAAFVLALLLSTQMALSTCALRCCLCQTDSPAGNASMSKMNGMERFCRVHTPGTKLVSIRGNCSYRIYTHKDPVFLPFHPDQLAVQVASASVPQFERSAYFDFDSVLSGLSLHKLRCLRAPTPSRLESFLNIRV